jgi:hypothetical protein
MPDTWMLLAAVLAIWAFRRWLELPSAGRFALALLCGAIAPLVKTPNLLIVAVPLAYLTIADWKRRGSQRVSHIGLLLVYGLCFALPSLLWMRHARGLPLDPRLSFGIGEKLFDTTLLIDPVFYLLLARWSVEHVVTWAGLPFLILGLLLAPTTDHRPPTTDHRRQQFTLSPYHLVTLSAFRAPPPLLAAWRAAVLPCRRCRRGRPGLLCLATGRARRLAHRRRP